jgi:hypothetical protein
MLYSPHPCMLSFVSGPRAISTRRFPPSAGGYWPQLIEQERVPLFALVPKLDTKEFSARHLKDTGSWSLGVNPLRGSYFWIIVQCCPWYAPRVVQAF